MLFMIFHCARQLSAKNTCIDEIEESTQSCPQLMQSRTENAGFVYFHSRLEPVLWLTVSIHTHACYGFDPAIFVDAYLALVQSIYLVTY